MAAGRDIERFASSLRLPRPASVHADFFLDLGGDSLTAVAAVVALRAAGATGAAVRDLYETRTAAALAERLRNTPGEPPTATAADPRPRSAGRPVGRCSVPRSSASGCWRRWRSAARGAAGGADRRGCLRRACPLEPPERGRTAAERRPERPGPRPEGGHCVRLRRPGGREHAAVPGPGRRRLG